MDDRISRNHIESRRDFKTLSNVPLLSYCDFVCCVPIHQKDSPRLCFNPFKTNKIFFPFMLFVFHLRYIKDSDGISGNSIFPSLISEIVSRLCRARGSVITFINLRFHLTILDHVNQPYSPILPHLFLGFDLYFQHSSFILLFNLHGILFSPFPFPLLTNAWEILRD